MRPFHVVRESPLAIGSLEASLVPCRLSVAILSDTSEVGGKTSPSSVKKKSVPVFPLEKQAGTRHNEDNDDTMTRPNRSVVDYDTEDALRKALMAVELPDDENDDADMKTSAESSNASDNKDEQESLDWVLSTFDAATTEVQSMKEELHRLQVLKSYLVLDAKHEESFERLTGVAARIFQVPICLISLVDLGRQWFMSNRGLGDVRETPRQHAFCSHVILCKNNMLIVPDATQDFRFKNNPLVTGPPNIRFYAGAPLISPEGYKLGTFCIIDDKTRPAGLSTDEQANLRDFADMAVKELVDRRYKLQTQENPAQLIAYTAHDLMTPLTGVQLSLSLLKEDEEVQERLGAHQLELLATAGNCSDLMIRICQTAIDTLRQESSAALSTDIMQPTKSSPVTKPADLVKSLSMIMEPIPKLVPLIITLDPSVPPMIMSDDLKLFRSALNLLSNAVSRTQLGSVHLKIYPKNDARVLMFECFDTGIDVEVEEYQYLFQPTRTEDGELRLGLSSVASLINSLDGEYGFRPRGVKEDGSIEGRTTSGSVFWFSVPLLVPESVGVSGSDDSGAASVLKKNTHNESASSAAKKHGPMKLPIIPVIQRSSSTNSISSTGNRKVPLVVNDIFEADAVRNSCFGTVFETNVRGMEQNDSRFPAVSHGPVARPPNYQSAAVANALTSASASAAAKPVAAEPRKRKALVIEDSLVVRKSIAMALKKLGFDVTQAVDGMEGLKRLKETMFDITLCDFLMPVMDGMDCVHQYRDWEKQNRPSFRQYIVGISAHASANDSGQGIKAGMDEFRAKPISIKTLTELQTSKAVTARTRLLDNLEGGSSATSTAAVVDGEPTGEDEPAVRKRHKQNSTNSGIIDQKPPSKRLMTQSAGLSMENTAIPVCLIATDTPTMQSNEVLTLLESNGWKVVVVHDGNDALRLLKMRNWDSVLVDDDIPLLAGAPCIVEFRGWEEQNRVNKQKNVFLVCDGEIASPFDKASIIQPPAGFDGVLRKPVDWRDLQYMLTTTGRDSSFEIVVRK